MTIRHLRHAACALSLTALAAPFASESTVQVNFSGAGGTVSGPGASNVQQLFDDTLFSGMFVIRNLDPTGFTGTLSFDGESSDDGVEFLLHLSTLESVEAVILQTGPSSRSDEITASNGRIIVPRTASFTDTGGNTGFFGAGSVTFQDGVLVEFEYVIGAEALSSYDFLFERAGVDVSMEQITISSGAISVSSQFIADGADPNADTPYGLNPTGYSSDEADNTTTRFEASDPDLCTRIYAGNTCTGTDDPYNNETGLNPFVDGQDLHLFEIGDSDLATAVLVADSEMGSDDDGDGVDTSVDNCTIAPNPDQTDTDGDGYGNACDADFNNDCIVNVSDIPILRDLYGQPDNQADLTGDGFTNVPDLIRVRELFNAAPGPSPADPCVSGP